MHPSFRTETYVDSSIIADPPERDGSAPEAAQHNERVGRALPDQATLAPQMEMHLVQTRTSSNWRQWPHDSHRRVE